MMVHPFLLRVITTLLCTIIPCSCLAIAKDEQKHILVSSLLGASSHLMVQSRPISYGFCLSAGAFKELYDSGQPDNIFSWSDMAFNLLGCTLGAEMVSLTWYQFELSPTVIEQQPALHIKWTW